MPIQDVFNREPEIFLKEICQQSSVLFNPARVAIMIELYHAGSVDFGQLKRDLELSDGALAAHLKALEEEELIKSRKESDGSRARKEQAITPKGITSLEKMISLFEKIGSDLKNDHKE